MCNLHMANVAVETVTLSWTYRSTVHTRQLLHDLWVLNTDRKYLNMFLIILFRSVLVLSYVLSAF